jgi:hypothetical protein
MSWRITVRERDLSAFSRGQNLQTGALNVISKKGVTYPILCQSQEDYIAWFGEPNGEYWGGYEVLQYLNEAPAWVVSSIGAGALHAGVDVRTNDVRGFGTDTGRNPLSFDLSSIKTQLSHRPIPIQPGTGTRRTFEFTLPIPVGSSFSPESDNAFKLKVGNRDISITSVESSSVGNVRAITSPALATSGSNVNVETGLVNIEFIGQEGTPAKYEALNILSGTVNLAGARDKGFNLNIDGVAIPNINLGVSGEATITQIIDVINQRIISAGLPTGLITEVNDKINISGQVADPNFGRVIISPPTDFTNLDNVISIIFDSTYTGGSLTQTTNAVAPPSSSFIPRRGEELTVDYIVTEDLRSEVSHSFFSTSPYNDVDFDYRVEVKHLRDKVYTLNLFRRTELGDIQIDNYTYSLDKIKDSSNRSIYIFDVFKNNPYVTPIVNSNYSGNAELQGFNQLVRLTGGRRGSKPSSTNISNSWQAFRKRKRYKIATFMDIYGNSPNIVADIIANNQKYAYGITMVPLGNGALDAIAYRQSLGLDFANMALYTNWQVIEDIYDGGGEIFVSGIGKIGVKYAQIGTQAFGALSPAGLDEDGLGGILNSGFAIIRMEQDYTDNELELMDNAQINPILNDDLGRYVISGDRTLQIPLSDTSYVGTRRVYNYILGNVIDNVLPIQEFKYNDEFHRDKMRSLIDDIINPVFVDGHLVEYEIVCNDSNNPPEVLNRREFVVDVYVKVTPNSQRIRLNFIRISQTQSIAQVIGA